MTASTDVRVEEDGPFGTEPDGVGVHLVQVRYGDVPMGHDPLLLRVDDNRAFTVPQYDVRTQSDAVPFLEQPGAGVLCGNPEHPPAQFPD